MPKKDKDSDNQEPKILIEDVEAEDLKPKPRPKLAPRGIETFTVCRQHDETGVSGEGVIIEGVVLVRAMYRALAVSSSSRWYSYFRLDDCFIKVHIEPHPGNKTLITYQDGEQEVYGD